MAEQSAKMFVVVAVSFLAIAKLLNASEDPDVFFRAPPRVEKNPILLDSFLPASMQIIAHLTELMKYDLKPQNNRPTPSTTTTQRPTSSHKPAILAPPKPLGPTVYFAKEVSFREYVQRLQNPVNDNYFDRYLPGGARSINLETPRQRNQSSRSYSNVYGNLPTDLTKHISKPVVDILHMVNRIDENFNPEDEEVQVEVFQKEYDDDSDFRYLLSKQKRMPPVKAYVGLLSLYDTLNKESKSLGLNKYGGYHQHILVQLVEASKGSSAEQLKFVLSKIVERRDTKKPDVLKKIKNMVKDLEEENSYINLALKYIPALPYSL